MWASINNFFAIRGLPPHGYCLLWEPSLIWTHVLADLVIALAYFSIPFGLWRLLRARRDIEFGWMVALFATFILACGTTHLLSIYVLWVPAYGIEAAVKVITALASIATAALLVPLLPKLVALPSPAQLRAVNEQLIAQASERERTEEMLRQSQKIEAIGRLTGGVAHDFNNLLQVVIGNLERAKKRASASEPELNRSLDQALGGAQRAAELTDQLLSFARRQPLEVKELDLAHVVKGVLPLIERAVGQAVNLSFDPGASVALVHADRHQLENALLNLAINARDAMPKGGDVRISIVAADIPRLVELRIDDTGVGMDETTLGRATEPFFTTKPVGHGTGLGLSQVYGMIEQIGGTMTIESEPGTGSRVRLFIPRETGTEATVSDGTAE